MRAKELAEKLIKFGDAEVLAELGDVSPNVWLAKVLPAIELRPVEDLSLSKNGNVLLKLKKETV